MYAYIYLLWYYFMKIMFAFYAMCTLHVHIVEFLFIPNGLNA